MPPEAERPRGGASGYGRKCYIKVFGKQPKAESTKPQQGRAVRTTAPESEQLPGQLSIYDLEQKKAPARTASAKRYKMDKSLPFPTSCRLKEER